MNSGYTVLLTLGIGVVAGLRSLTAPAVVAWAAHIGWINLHGSPLAFMGSAWAVGVFTVLAVVELVADQLPGTPSRTAPVGLSARIVTSALSGACLAIAGGAMIWLGALAGAVGGMLISKVVGYILQSTGSYVPIFIIAGSAYLVALAIIQLLVPKLEPARLE